MHEAPDWPMQHCSVEGLQLDWPQATPPSTSLCGAPESPVVVPVSFDVDASPVVPPASVVLPDPSSDDPPQPRATARVARTAAETRELACFMTGRLARPSGSAKVSLARQTA